MADFKVNIIDVLEGRVDPPTMPGPNPYPLWTTEWYAWKEQNLGYVPYHVGNTPSGGDCRTMPRVSEVRPGVYRCPSCGKEFPTATAQLDGKIV